MKGLWKEAQRTAHQTPASLKSHIAHSTTFNKLERRIFANVSLEAPFKKLTNIFTVYRLTALDKSQAKPQTFAAPSRHHWWWLIDYIWISSSMFTICSFKIYYVTWLCVRVSYRAKRVQGPCTPGRGRRHLQRTAACCQQAGWLRLGSGPLLSICFPNGRR